jgi:hypothetical protein
MLFIDDGAFIFNSRDDLSRGLEIIVEQFANFGLEVHIGQVKQQVKLEVYTSPSLPGSYPQNTPQSKHHLRAH